MRFQQLLGLLLAFLSLLIFARPGLPTQQFGCGASPSAENLAAISQVGSSPFAHSGQAQKRFDGFPSSTNFSSFGQIEIDTWIHVVALSQTLEDGWISDEQVTAQMVELNANFAPQKIKFSLKGVTRTIDATWGNDQDELAMKQTLRKGDYKTLNIYFQASNKRGYGYSHFPGIFPEGSDDFFYDGISARSDTVPDGTVGNYNLGRTVTHEAGHWFGLLHTFMEYDCDSPTGDLIADTPAQRRPTAGCPISEDSCPNQPGLDPIHNYMDYSFDRCYEEFTPLQTKRMHDIYHAYRSPRTCHADDCLRTLRASTIPGRIEESTGFCGELTKVIVSDVTLLKDYMTKGCAIGGEGDGGIMARVSSACTCLPASPSGAMLPSLVVLPPATALPTEVSVPSEMPSGVIWPYPTSGSTIVVPAWPSRVGLSSGVVVSPLPTGGVA